MEPNYQSISPAEVNHQNTSPIPLVAINYESNDYETQGLPGFRSNYVQRPTINYVTNDPLVNRVISKMKARSDVGMVKYGVTMERHDTHTQKWLQHAQEEALDLAIYLQRCIEDLDK